MSRRGARNKIDKDEVIQVYKDNSGFKISNLEILDNDLVLILNEFSKESFEDIIRSAIKIGLISLKNSGTIKNIDYIEKNFVKFGSSMENQFNDLENNIDDYFGNKGTVTSLFDLNKKNSLSSILLETLNNTLQESLDLNSPNSSLSKLKLDFEGNIQQIRDELISLRERRIGFEKSSAKGVEFEEHLSEFLELRARIFGDIVKKVGTLSVGKRRSKKGDIVINISEPGLSHKPTIIVEAKDRGEITIDGKEGLLSEIRSAISNRNADFGIAVVKEVASIPNKNGIFRFYPEEKSIICGFGEDGLPMELAYQFARYYLITECFRDEEEKGSIDLEKLTNIFKIIENKLKKITNLKKNLTEIKNISESTSEELDDFKSEIRELIKESFALIS